MDIKLSELKLQISENLERHLREVVPLHHSFQEIYEYALFPPGKLLRPLLVWGVYEDYRKKNDFSEHNHSYFASFVEIHHTYTLLHDDLPCMDNDELRRGKPATHIKYGQWQALLAGDGLLNASYALLSRLQTSRLTELLRFITWCAGPKGLIQGQVLDLSEEAKTSFNSVVETHKLKTARLFQASLVGSYILVPKEHRHNHFLSLFKLGHHFGILFQLLDDLDDISEYGDVEVGSNAFLSYPTQAYKQLEQSYNVTQKILERLELKTTSFIISTFLGSLVAKCQKLTNIAKKKPELVPAVSFLQTLNTSNQTL